MGISNIKAVGDKRRQLLNTEEAKYLAAEQQKIVAKELKQRVSAVRKLIEEHQKQQKDSGTVNRSHKSSHLGNPSKTRQSVTGGSHKIASVATSRSSKRQGSDKLELENLKAKQEDEQRLREREMQLENEREEMKLQAEREEREMEMRKRERELENERKKAEAEEERRQLELEQKRGSS